MIDLRGFSAWITSDDMELVEFEPHIDEKNRTVTCWIVGPVGKTFIVHWRDHGSQVESASYIYFDGFKVSGQFLYGYGEELRRGIRVGPQEERPFVFSQIGPDDGIGYGPMKPHKNVGSIMLEIRQVQRMEGINLPEVRATPPVIRGHRPEGEVCVRYGEIRPTAMQKPTWRLRPYDPNDPGPFVTFIFRYRTHDWLISQGIVGPDENIFRDAPTQWPINNQALSTPSTGSSALTVSELSSDGDEDDGDDEDDEDEDDTDYPGYDFEASPGFGEYSPDLDFGLSPLGYEPGPEPSPGPSTCPSTGPSPGHSPGHSNVASPRQPRSTPAGLGVSGVHPQSSRHTPTENPMRAFSGTWDPISATTGQYEQLSWDEYRLEDRETLANYYRN